MCTRTLARTYPSYTAASPAGLVEWTEDNMLYGTQLHLVWRLIEARKDVHIACCAQWRC